VGSILQWAFPAGESKADACDSMPNIAMPICVQLGFCFPIARNRLLSSYLRLSLQVYAGHKYRRTYASVLKNPLDVAEPFNPSMMQVDTKQEVSIAGPFEVFETTALALVQHQRLHHEIEMRREEFPNHEIQVSLRNIRSYRVM